MHVAHMKGAGKMKLRFIRKAQSVDGNRGKALVFVAEAFEHLTETYGLQVTCVLEVGGRA